eukprot:UN27542
MADSLVDHVCSLNESEIHYHIHFKYRLTPTRSANQIKLPSSSTKYTRIPGYVIVILESELLHRR